MTSNRPDENKRANSDAGQQNSDEILLGDFIRIVDKKTQKVIVQGQVHYEKDNVPPTPEQDELIALEGTKRLLSIDNKWFFRLDDDAYTVEKIDVNLTDDDFIEKNYKIQEWREYIEAKRAEFDVYRENTVEELDEGMENIVEALNGYSPYIVTVGSCSGHGKKPAWVSIRAESAEALINFINVFDVYRSKLDLTTERKLHTHRAHFRNAPFFPSHIELTIRTIDVGHKAIKTLDEFAKYLRKVSDLKIKTNILLEETMTQERMLLRQQQNQKQP